MKESTFILFSRIFRPSLFIEFNRTKFHIDLIKAVIRCNNVAWSVAPVKTNLKSVKVMLWQTNSVSHGQMAAFTLTSIMSYWVSAIGSNLFGLLKSWICCATQSCLSYYLKISMLKFSTSASWFIAVAFKDYKVSCHKSAEKLENCGVFEALLMYFCTLRHTSSLSSPFPLCS